MLYSIVLSSVMLFKRLFGLTSSLFFFICSQTRSPRLWDVNSGSGNSCNSWAVLIAFVDFNCSNCERKGQSYPVEYYLESVEKRGQDPYE